MSQVPPPLPPQQSSPYGASSPPPVPMPVQPIVYGTPSRTSGRPGILTAIGILSIVIGALGILFNAGMGMTTFGVMMASRASRAFATASTPATPLPTPETDPNSMTARERRIVMNGLTKNHNLSPARRRQLDAILVEGGRRMVFGAGPSLTPDVVAANISDHGSAPAKGDEAAHDFFILGRGRLELFDDRAVFIPQDGTETIRTEAPEPDEGDPMVEEPEPGTNVDDESASATQPAGLTPRQVKAVVQHVDSLLKAQASTPQRTLNPAQTKTLTARFSDPQGGFFSPAADLPAARAQVASAYGLPNGTVMVSTQLGTIQVDTAGVVVSSFTQASFAATRAGMGFQVDELAVLLSLLGCLAGFVLSIYLIVAGSLVMRQHGKGGKMHKIYAWLKIPLAIGCAIVWVWMWSSVARGAAQASGVQSMNWGPRLTIAAIAVALLGVAYPLALLLALRTRAVRDYYGSAIPARADGWRTG